MKKALGQLILCCGLTLAASHLSSGADVYPGKICGRMRPPEQVGGRALPHWTKSISPATALSFATETRSNSWGDPSSPSGLASATKPVISTMLAIASGSGNGGICTRASALRLCVSAFRTLIFFNAEAPRRRAKSLGLLGSFAKWSKVEIVLHGPESAGLGTPNPFRIKADLAFSGPGDSTYTVPAFYDGDGRGGMNGNVWKVRFSPDAAGIWNFECRSESLDLNGYRGTFRVTEPDKNAPDFFRWGRLEYVGEHYLKFRDGGYWFKAGADEPENFLGNAFGKDDWANKKAEVSYLAKKGINCMYVMTHTLEGDGKDVWPWYGKTQKEAKAHSDRFDVARLAKWEDLFLHMQNEGIVIHLVLEDDSAWTGFDRPLYYREMVARFGYLPALYFNICEEYNERYSLERALKHAVTLRDLDPFNHPIAIHNVNEPTAAYLNNPSIEVTSIQGYKEGNALAAFDAAVKWRRQSEAAGKKLAVSFDEYMNYPTENTSEARAIARRTAWGAALGGGIVEVYTSPLGSFAEYESFWDDLRHLRHFMEKLPFWEMEPDRSLVSKGVCSSIAGSVYAIYLPDGGSATLDLSAANGKFTIQWYDPRTGAFHKGRIKLVEGGGVVSLGEPPIPQDAACLVKRAN